MQELLQAFISYKRENQDFAETLYELLADLGFLPWLDIHNIPKGISEESSGWIAAIDNGLRESQVLIGLITPLSLESENVQNEWKWAKLNNRRIFFIRVEEYELERISHQFVEAVYIEKDNLDELEQALRSFANQRQALKTEVTDTGRQNRSLNQEVLSDLEALAKKAPATPKKDKLIGSAIPSRKDEAVLRDRTRRYWPESILKPSLQEAAAFNIALSLQADAVIEHENLGNFELGGSIDIYNTYKALKSFLIMGEAGSGKTVMLLQLATKLLRYEKTDIPLVLNLSSWGNEAIPLEDWLVKEAERTYQIRGESFKRWLADKKLILLLDGLDEIKEEVRAERIQRINAFRKNNHSISMMICSRIAEYRLTTEDAAEKKLDFPHALRLEPLSKEQIESYLSQPQFGSVKALYNSDAIVRDLAQIPFLLTTMAYTYKEEHIRQLELKKENNRFTRLSHLFDCYITKQLKSFEPLKYTNAQVRQFLELIAIKTTVYGTVFRPKNITIEWFRDDEKLWPLYQLTSPNNQLAITALISSRLPWPIDQFIHQMTERQIMRPMGGGHLFRHDYLRQSLLGTIPTIAQIKWLIRDLEDEGRKELAVKGLLDFGAITVPYLIEALTDNPFREYQNLILRILILIGKPAFENLIHALNDDDKTICQNAIKAIVLLGDNRAIEPLISKLSDTNAEVRKEVAWSLGKLGDNRAVEPLIETLKDEDKGVRKVVANSLVELRDSRTVELLIKALKDEEIRKIAAKVLISIGASSVKPLIEALKDEEIRKIAAKVLISIGASSVKPLIEALKDEDKGIHEVAVELLLSIGTSSVEPLIEALEHRDKVIRGNAAYILGRMSDNRAVKALIEVLKDEDVEVRRSVAEALHWLRDDRIVEPLIEALKDEDIEVLRIVAHALRSLRDSRAVKPLIEILKHEDIELRRIVADALSGLRNSQSIELLIEALKDANKTVRGNAAYILAELRDSRAVEPLIEALKDVNKTVRGNAAYTLGELRDSRAVEPLIEALKDKDIEVLKIVVKSLGKLGDSGVVEPLIKLLEYGSLRKEVAEALGKLRDGRAVEPLVKMLKTENDWDRFYATNALRKIGTPEALKDLKKANFDE